MNGPRARSSRTGGFSLLEVLLAMSLVIVMMAAIFSFYQFALRIRATSHRRVHRAQLARTLLEQIAHDLRGIAPNTTKYTPVLRGNPEILDCLTAAVPDPQLFADRSITGSGPARQMDLRRIMWFLAVNEEEYDENNDPLIVGIVRRTQRNLDPFKSFVDEETGEIMEDQGGMASDDEEYRTFYDQLVTTEIRFLEFSYYNGQKWLQKWEMPEGPAGVMIPVAIRVTIGFASVPADELDARREEDVDYLMENPAEYRSRFTTVVRLPAADVMLGTMSRLRDQMSEEYGLGG